MISAMRIQQEAQMLTPYTKTISIPGALRLVGVIAGVWAVLVAAATTLAYLPEHSEFSLA